MKASTLALSQILLLAASVAAAVTRGHGLAARVAARGEIARLTHPKVPAVDVNEDEAANRTNVDYSSNWSGGVLTAPPSGTKFTSVTAQFTVPKPSLPSGATQDSYASAWVGIDGDTYTTAILQTGVDFGISTSGQISYDAWYEWYPDYAYDFSGIDISTGDTIRLTVTSTNNDAGVAVIENLSNGQSVTQSLKAPSSTATLGGQNAEWIVEDFDSNGRQVPFADFGTVRFIDAAAGTEDGGTVGTSEADLLDISQNGKVLTSASAPSDTEIVVEWTVTSMGI
ncbi:aspergillopepsin-2 precursor, putative [Talaromyces stipitatus ATCC 10500]|uniref:Aspergillopepsin-2, putative n=1 Tax=Talaromyces stipitatus (strain ATCC 10500 / CBS 375.48 / QM 6759 / NRRL 1006) TaxID=441959 RepID=B8M4C0_TALSN|nr:aspergillopepsin-2 precursor, putative [Talaromyces stipitatus ATCC 10500]EED19115.1 aspergillopepsin-2 precursor, putative [Talaromyces stipitatus ATCC 10500]